MELTVTQWSGHNCKLAALAGIENFFAAYYHFAAIPLHKLRVHERSIRQIAKNYGSVTGEVLEIAIQQKVAEALGYTAKIETFTSLAQFRKIISRNLQYKIPMAICFAVQYDGIEKGLPSKIYNNNEHCAVIKEYLADNDDLIISHWNKDWLVSVSELYESNCCLPHTRTAETYIRAQTTKYFYQLPQTERIKYELHSNGNPLPDSLSSMVKRSIIPCADSGFKGRLLAINPLDNQQELLPSLMARKLGGAFYRCMQNHLCNQIKKYALEVLQDDELVVATEKVEGICLGLATYVAIQHMSGKIYEAETVLSALLTWDGNTSTLSFAQTQQFTQAISIICQNQFRQKTSSINAEINDSTKLTLLLNNYIQEVCLQNVIQLQSQDQKAGNFNFASLNFLLNKENLMDNHCFISNMEHVIYVTFISNHWHCFDANHPTIDGLVKIRQFPLADKDKFIEQIIIDLMKVTRFANCNYKQLHDVFLPLKIALVSFKNCFAQLTKMNQKLTEDIRQGDMTLLQNGGLYGLCQDLHLENLDFLLSHAEKYPIFAAQLLCLFRSLQLSTHITTAFHILCYRRTKHALPLLTRLLALSQKHDILLLNVNQSKQTPETIVYDLLLTVLSEKNSSKFILLCDYLRSSLDKRFSWTVCVKKLYNNALAFGEEGAINYLNRHWHNDLSSRNQNYGTIISWYNSAVYTPLTILDHTEIKVVSDTYAATTHPKNNQAYIYYDNLHQEWWFLIKDSRGLEDKKPLFWYKDNKHLAGCGKAILLLLRENQFKNLTTADKNAILHSIKLIESKYWRRKLEINYYPKPIIYNHYFPLGQAIKSNNPRIVAQYLTQKFLNRSIGPGSLSELINGVPSMTYANYGLNTFLDLALYNTISSNNLQLFNIVLAFAMHECNYQFNHQLFLTHAIELGAINIIFALLDMQPNLQFTAERATYVLQFLGHQCNDITQLKRLVDEYHADLQQISPITINIFNTPKNVGSLLHVATINNNINLCQFLLERNYPVNKLDSTNMTALLYAVKLGYPALVALLLKYKPNIRISPSRQLGYHALIEAAKSNFVMLKMLLTYDPKVINLANAEDGATALQLASYHNNEVAAAYLIHKGANVWLSHKRTGRSPIHYMAKNGNVNLLELVHRKYTLNLEHVDFHGWTLLHFATGAQQLHVIKFLSDVMVNIDLNIPDMGGNPLIMYAVANGDEAIVDFLLSKKINLRIKNKAHISILSNSIEYAQRFPSIVTKIANAIVMDYLAKHASPTTAAQYLAFVTIMGEVRAQQGKINLEQLNTIKKAYEPNCALDLDLSQASKFARLENLERFQSMLENSRGYYKYCKHKLYYSNTLFFPYHAGNTNQDNRLADILRHVYN